MAKEKKRSFSVGDVVYNRTVGVCDVIMVYEVDGKRRLQVQDTEGYQYENIRPKEVIKCDEVFVPECIYIYGFTQYIFREDITLTRQVSRASDLITDYVGVTSNRAENNLSNVGYYKVAPDGVSGTIQGLVADSTLVPQTARHIQVQKHNLEQKHNQSQSE